MALVEINFDGIVGPTHNYAGLSPGNLASSRNAGALAWPRAAALQGLEKMRANLALGLAQGLFPPLDRPDSTWLAELGTGNDAPAHLRAAAWSASAMWAANAATVSPAPDTADGRCHLSVANLVTMAHRSHEWPGTLANLRAAFADDRHFAVHGPVPPCFGDEGAANHMRTGARHGAPCAEIFVYGVTGGAYPARQHREASAAIARRHGLSPDRTIFIEQAQEAIAAGAFHNDVVAVANEHVLLVHERAFARPEEAYTAIRDAVPGAEIIVVPAAAVSLADAIKGYLFNAQLVTLPESEGPDTQEMALIVPTEALATPSIAAWGEALLRGNGPIRRIIPVDVRQSMANGGGPACLRLRVVADPATVDPRFMADHAKLDRLAAVIEQHWPESIAADQLGTDALAEQVIAARRALLDTLDLSELI